MHAHTCAGVVPHVVRELFDEIAGAMQRQQHAPGHVAKAFTVRLSMMEIYNEVRPLEFQHQSWVCSRWHCVCSEADWRRAGH